jgi:hypothetical protein
MTLEEAWKLLGSINDIANQLAVDQWAASDIEAAVTWQTIHFQKQLIELDKERQNAIQYWYNNDDEFQDYFKCLIGE